MEVNGSDYVRRSVPGYARVYAPRSWRGETVRVLVPADGYTIDVEEGLVRVQAEPAYDRTTTLEEEGEGNPQLYVGSDHEGETVLLVRDPID